MTFEIYKVTNTINGKLYVGQTTIGYLKRFKKHKRSIKYADRGDPFARAMRKYGTDVFICELIETAANQEELNQLEIKWIADLNTLTPNGYNILIGGQCGPRHKDLCKAQRDHQSGYIGVRVMHGRGTFKAKIIRIDKDHHLGSFPTAKDAAHAFDYKAIELYGDDAGLNFPDLRDAYLKNEVKVTRIYRGHVLDMREPNPVKPIRVHKKRRVYTYRGVKQSRTMWVTKFNDKTYPTELDAAIAYDIEEFNRNGEYANLNFPENASKYADGSIKPNSFRNRTSSKYRGVCFTKGKWSAQVCVKRRPKHLGYFATQEEAARAYDARAKELFGDKAKLNFPS